MEWSNDTIAEFLILYENEPALWNPKTAEYRNRNDQYDAWARIQRQIKGGTISIKELKKKRDNLMATYRKIRRKMKESSKTASGANYIFKPDWPFYNFMSKFLDDVYYPRKPKNFADPEDKEENDKTKQDDDEENTPIKMTIILPKRTKKGKPEKGKGEPYNCLKKQMAQTLQTPQDECGLYTELLCKKLRGLQEKTREIAMLEIDRLIYNLKHTEILTLNSYAQVPSVPVCPPQAFHFGQSHLVPHFSDSEKHSHRSCSPKPFPSYNATPSPQPSTTYNSPPSAASGEQRENSQPAVKQEAVGSILAVSDPGVVGP